jgi:hypothetical protein
MGWIKYDPPKSPSLCGYEKRKADNRYAEMAILDTKGEPP